MADPVEEVTQTITLPLQALWNLREVLNAFQRLCDEEIARLGLSDSLAAVYAADGIRKIKSKSREVSAKLEPSMLPDGFTSVPVSRERGDASA